MIYDEMDAMIQQLLELRAVAADLSDDDIVRDTRCPGWRVAELIGHCEGMVLPLVGESAQPVEGAPEIDRVDVYRRTDQGRSGVVGVKGPEVDRKIFDRVVQYTSGRRPDQLRMSFLFAIDGAVRVLPEIPGDRVVIRPPSYPRMTHRELLASRIVEMAVHTTDIADAVGHPEHIPPAAAAVVTGIFDPLVGGTMPEALGWEPIDYISCATGRRSLTSEERGVLGPLAENFPLPYWRAT
jgi:uncharacterized protein (TIGR03083 family)